MDIVIKKVLCHDGVLGLSLGGSPGVALERSNRVNSEFVCLGMCVACKENICNCRDQFDEVTSNELHIDSLCLFISLMKTARWSSLTVPFC